MKLVTEVNNCKGCPYLAGHPLPYAYYYGCKLADRRIVISEFLSVGSKEEANKKLNTKPCWCPLSNPLLSLDIKNCSQCPYKTEVNIADIGYKSQCNHPNWPKGEANWIDTEDRQILSLCPLENFD